VVVEKVLESNCEECKKVKEKMSHPDCIQMKGAKVSPDVLYICHACLDKKNKEWREEKFPEEYAKIAELRKQNKTYKNNVPQIKIKK
jgi:hypothetical protein